MNQVLGLLAAFLAAAGGTELTRRYALRRGVLDLPNARSSHRQPTPRGGGLAVVLVFLLGLLGLWLGGAVSTGFCAGLGGGGLALAVVGFADDHRPVPAGVRMAVHLLATAWALWWLGGGLSIDFGAFRLTQPLLVYGLAAVLIVWTVNLFNFMDGIDGIAGSQATFAAAASALWLHLAGAAPGWVAAALLLAAASAGFLSRNWPPARIFMGDVGSGFLGYALAALLIAGLSRYDASPWPWLIFTGLFWADATYTLFHRLLRRQNLAAAHRSHAYQILARRWGGHRQVTLSYIAVNLLWLSPLAAAAQHWRGWGFALWAVAMLPLFLLAWRIGAGGADD